MSLDIYNLTLSNGLVIPQLFYNETPVITEKTLTVVFGPSVEGAYVKQAFTNNAHHFCRGVDYFVIEGDDCANFKAWVKDVMPEHLTRYHFFRAFTVMGYTKLLRCSIRPETWNQLGELLFSYFQLGRKLEVNLADYFEHDGLEGKVSEKTAMVSPEMTAKGIIETPQDVAETITLTPVLVNGVKSSPVVPVEPSERDLAAQSYIALCGTHGETPDVNVLRSILNS